jgi:hypothetical protein
MRLMMVKVKEPTVIGMVLDPVGRDADPLRQGFVGECGLLSQQGENPFLGSFLGSLPGSSPEARLCVASFFLPSTLKLTRI